MAASSILESKAQEWYESGEYIFNRISKYSNEKIIFLELLEMVGKDQAPPAMLVREKCTILSNFGNEISAKEQDLATYINTFASHCETIFVKPDKFADFKQVVKAKGWTRKGWLRSVLEKSTEDARREAEEEARREAAWRAEQQRRAEERRRNEEESRRWREEQQRRQAEEQRRRQSSSPTLIITGVTFGNGDIKGNVLNDFGSTPDTSWLFLMPRITYQVKIPTESKEIWYKIFNPAGKLMQTADETTKYTWYGKVPGYTDGSCSLGGFGSDQGGFYAMAGTWRIEFYENDRLIYQTAFQVKEKKTESRKRPNESSYSSSHKENTSGGKKGGHGCLWTLIIVALCAVAWWGYGKFTDAQEEKNTPKYYVFANNLNMRSSMNAEVEYNQIGLLPYGTRLLTSANDGVWAKVKVDGEEGYVSADYILDENDFFWLNGVWGNEEAKEMVETAKCRLAVLHYLKRDSLATDAAGWHLITKQKEIKPNAVLYPSLNNGYDYFTEFAFILKNATTGERRLAIYSFEKDETPVLVYEDEAPTTGDIASITYNRRNGRYRVNYADGNTPLVQSTKKRESPQASLTVTRVRFANADEKGRLLSEYGKQLYTDIKFLTPLINYRKSSAKEQTFKLYVKVFSPNGVLLNGKTSPDGYSFTQNVVLQNKLGTVGLVGWGNTDGRLYAIPGEYLYEIWCDGKKLYTASVNVKSK